MNCMKKRGIKRGTHLLAINVTPTSQHFPYLFSKRTPLERNQYILDLSNEY